MLQDPGGGGRPALRLTTGRRCSRPGAPAAESPPAS